MKAAKTAIQQQREVFRAKQHRELFRSVDVIEERDFFTKVAANRFIDDRLSVGLACAMREEHGRYVVRVLGVTAWN